MSITNSKLADHDWLQEMAADGYFPNFLVAKVADVLKALCVEIEDVEPATDEAMLELTHAATMRINDLEEEFHENGSEIETAARDCIAGDFGVIMDAYGFGHLDLEEVIAPREW